jgi:hypothetical protein
MEGTLRGEDWTSIRKVFSNCCAYCGEKCTGDPRTGLTPDHVEPHAQGGELVPENVIPACQDCNDCRGSNNWREFILERFPAVAQERCAKIESYLQRKPYVVGSPESRLPAHLLEDYRRIEKDWEELYGRMKGVITESWGQENFKEAAYP